MNNLTFPLSDKDFYLLLTKTYATVKEVMEENGITNIPRIMIWGAGETMNISFSSGYGNGEIKVEGKEISVLVNEFIRRSVFNRQQKTIAIGPTVIENKIDEIPYYETLAKVENEDEIPF